LLKAYFNTFIVVISLKAVIEAKQEKFLQHLPKGQILSSCLVKVISNRTKQGQTYFDHFNTTQLPFIGFSCVPLHRILFP